MAQQKVLVVTPEIEEYVSILKGHISSAYAMIHGHMSQNTEIPIDVLELVLQKISASGAMVEQIEAAANVDRTD